MEKQHPAFKIKLLIEPDGSVKTSLQAENDGTPIHGLIFFHHLEPEILKFKKSVQRAISAYYGHDNKTGR